MNRFAIEIRNLSKYFRTQMTRRKIRALEDLSLTIEPGEIFGFLGPNGAGKTTTIKILTGLIFPSSGQAFIFDRPVTDISIRKKTGYLPEHPYFYAHLTGSEFLDFCIQVHNIHCQDKRKFIEESLAKVGLKDAGDLLISKYSKGMVQRLGIAQALINDPDLLIFDEPMEGLDPLGRKDVKDIMLEMKKKGKTVFFSTHILPDVEVICDRVGILLNGRLASVGHVDELLKQSIESIEVTAIGLTEDGIEIVGRSATYVNQFGKEIQFIFSTPDDADQAVDKIRELGGRLISLQPHTKTLEEHFITQVLKNR